MDVFGTLQIRIHVVFSRDADGRERGRRIVVRTIHCERSEAREHFRKFCEMNPNLMESGVHSEFTLREIVH